jgi:hypothetical protein
MLKPICAALVAGVLCVAGMAAQADPGIPPGGGELALTVLGYRVHGEALVVEAAADGLEIPVRLDRAFAPDDFGWQSRRPTRHTWREELAPPVVKVDDKPKKKAKTCAEAVIDKGYHPQHLESCKGAEPKCAVALIERGHHPVLLDHCRAVEPACAQAVLGAGYHPIELAHCTHDLGPRCTRALIRAGHHPILLDGCGGVDDVCAEKLLKSGAHPSTLETCRQR